LRKELRQKEKKVVSELITGAKVVLSTLHGAGSYELTSLYKDESLNLGKQNPLFDTIIIDEVSQSLEPQCWIPLINHYGFRRLVIAGDNMQLPPTIKSKDIPKQEKPDSMEIADLEVTLFDRLVKFHDGDEYKKLLDTQYRMNELIMQFPSKELYENKLKADKSVQTISLADLDIGGEDTGELIWYDTQGGDFPEQWDDDALGDTGSKYNEMESLIVMKHLRSLLESGVKHEDIGIISPYNAQVSLIKQKLYQELIENVEVSTVDGFQGREKQVIIITLVRSNENHEPGFLRDKRRLNVAMTRSKRQLCVIGDIEMLQRSGSKFLSHWGEFVENGEDYDLRYPDLGDY
jgi:DNA polymerase alpha-associated DNA helicase A